MAFAAHPLSHTHARAHAHMHQVRVTSEMDGFTCCAAAKEGIRAYTKPDDAVCQVRRILRVELPGPNSQHWQRWRHM